MANAPFRFSPPDWLGFFKEYNWTPRETRYLALESEKLGRKIPRSWWMNLTLFFTPPKKRAIYQKLTAYVVLEAVEPDTGHKKM
jgi:hypothetical protein